ncbi:TonB-dependent receptor plug domain-containing protein [Sphingomonas bacterium]|uniref:TonB-dependent receptor plug domain-containing protein n=1 Tax=Sphingomonas bacterium TaxID=1895847 RepID=UPI001576941A|nr:TonB-dependent receptor [Sphingomonas bacterium]
MKKISLLATTAFAAMAMTSVGARAQTVAAGGQSDNKQAPDCVANPAAAGCDTNGTAETANETVVVTGSRIARPELQSATPLAVVGSEQLQRQGITNVQDEMNQLPQVGIPGVSKTNSNFATGGNGVATVNLRNLGDNRTLVLVNGRRFVAGLAGTSVVDVNDIPTDFIDRIEVVTGGASAVYGSDAIAGVVNYVLKDNFKGVTARAQYGFTQRGDTPTYTASLTAGTRVGPDDRGAIMGNFTFDNDEGLLSSNRGISSQDCSAAGCGPQSYSTYAPQGRFQFYNNGAPTGNAGFASNLFTFNPDNSVVIGFPTGYGFNRESLRRISTPVKRYLGTAIGHYRITDGIEAYVEGTYVKVKSSSQIEPYALGSDNDLGFGYSITNPFIPTAIQAQIAARNSDAIATNNVDQISFRRRQNDVFSRSNRNDRDTYRIAGGLRGEFAGDFKYDLSVVYGELKDHTETQDLDTTKYAFALDAVRDATGAIVCRNATARAAGCVPINLFGYNTVAPAAAAYVAAAVPRTEDVKNTELVTTGSVTGSVFQLPAGPVQVSVGGEYRREKSVDNFDALTNAGQNTGNQLADTIGKFDVKEGFGEVDVPLLKQKPFFYSLSVQGAARYSDYSTIGHVFSWNAGGEYAPFNGLRFRGNYAVANRAPNIGELFSQPSENFPSVQDPCNGVTASSTGTYAAACRATPSIAAAIARNGSLTYTLADIQNINGFDGGNPNLSEEKGKTITAGVVIVPQQLRGFSLSVDYFNIKVSNAVGTVPESTSVQQCLLTGLPQFCNSVIRNPNTGFLTTVNASLVNIADFKTSGIDVDMRYGHNVGLINGDRVDLHAFYTHSFKYDTQSDPSAPIDHGVGNLEYGEVFRDKVSATLNYSLSGFNLSWTTNYLSHMYDTVPGEFAQTVIDLGLTDDIAKHNNIKSRLYHNAQFSFDVGPERSFQFFFGVNNVFDRKPPKLEDTVFYGTITGATTAADVYDPFGRRYYAGAQIHF